MEEYLAREVKLFLNKLGDEIELEILQYADRYKVVATICEDYPPYRDYIAIGENFHSRLRAKQGSQRSKSTAIKMALAELYAQAYLTKSHS